jgi:hypothetical protein
MSLDSVNLDWPPLALQITSPQRIFHYDPHSQQQRRGLRIKNDEWTKYQSTLEQLWMLENKSLGDVRKIMAEQYGFNASYAVPFITKSFCNLDRRPLLSSWVYTD